MLKQKIGKLNSFISGSSQKCLYFIIIFSFILSAGYAFYHRITPAVDARAYDLIALNIVNGNGFVEIAGQDPKFDPAITRAGPGYEYFLAIVYKLFGHYYGYIWIIQAILHALTALLVYFIAKRVFDKGGEYIGLIAAVFIGFSPDLIEISAMLMTETLYLFLLTAVIYAFIHLAKKNTDAPVASAMLGIFTGLAVLNRPTAGLFAVIIAFYFLSKKKYKNLILFLLLLIAVLIPWTARNYRVYNQIIPTTLIGEYNLWLNNTPSSNGGQFSDEQHNPLNEYTKIHGYSSLAEKADMEFKTFLTKHPWAFLKLSFIRFIRYFSLIRPMGFWFYQSGLPQLVFISLSAIYIAILFITGFAGIWLSLRLKNTLLYYLIAFAVTSPLTLIPVVVQSRYRFQIYPMLAIFGGYMIYRCRDDWPLVRKGLKYVSIILFLISAVDLFLFAGTVSDRIKNLI